MATDTSAVLKGVDDPFTSYTQNHLNYLGCRRLYWPVFIYTKEILKMQTKYAKAVIGSNKFPLISSNVARCTQYHPGPNFFTGAFVFRLFNQYQRL